MVKRFAVLFFLAAAAAFGQAPDCAQVFDFTATGATASVPNVQVGCTGWTMVYESTGFSAVTLEFQSSDGSTAPLAFVTYTGTVVSGSNPATSTVGGPAAAVNFKGYVGFWRVSATVTGTGRLRGTLLGYRPGFTNAAGGGGGSGGCTGAVDGNLCYIMAGAFAPVAFSTWDPAANSLIFVEPVSGDQMLTFFNDALAGDNGDPLFALNDFFTSPPDQMSSFGLDGSEIHLNAMQGGESLGMTNANGGQGGLFNVFGGDGGRGSSGSNNDSGGDGGMIQVIAGFGGGSFGGPSNSKQGGTGGEVIVEAGDGGNTSGQGMTDTGGDGGIVEILPGQGGFGATTNGRNGTIMLESAGGSPDQQNDIVEITTLFGGSVLSFFDFDGRYNNRTRTFAQLGTEADRQQVYCSDCTVTDPTDNTCMGGGSGAMAFGINGVYKCLV